MKFSPESTAYLVLLIAANTSTPAVSAFVPTASCTARTTSSFETVLHHGLKRGSKQPTLRFASPDFNNSSDESRDVGKKVDKSRDKYIDAIVEERTAGLAEADEENTSVSCF